MCGPRRHAGGRSFVSTRRATAWARRSIDGPFRLFDLQHHEYEMTVMDEFAPADSRESTCCHCHSELNVARGATKPVSFISLTARERIAARSRSRRRAHQLMRRTPIPQRPPRFAGCPARRIHPSSKVRTDYETSQKIREGSILYRLQNSMFSMAYLKNTHCANDFVLPRLIKMFSRTDKYFAGANRD